jgi:hypothetical protein
MFSLVEIIIFALIAITIGICIFLFTRISSVKKSLSSLDKKLTSFIHMNFEEVDQKAPSPAKAEQKAAPQKPAEAEVEQKAAPQKPAAAEVEQKAAPQKPAAAEVEVVPAQEKKPEEEEVVRKNQEPPEFPTPFLEEMQQPTPPNSPINNPDLIQNEQ